MADVTFDGTTFTGDGNYTQAAGTAESPLSTNLVVTGSTDSSTITLSGGFYTTGTFRHSKGVLEIAEGTENTCKDFGVQKGGANGTTAYIKGTLHVTNQFMGNYTKSCTSNIYISGNVTVDGSFMSSNANSAQSNIYQTDGVVNFLTSNDLAIRIAHFPTAAQYPCRYNLSGGTFNVPNTTTYVGWNGPGELNISGGTANLKGIQLVGGYNGTTGDYANGKGTINLTGGRLNIGDGGVTLKNERHAINLGDGTIGASESHTWASALTVTLTSGKTPTFEIDANKTITIDSTVSGSGNLTKTGAGALTLSGSNNYSGTTTITSGTLTATKIGSIGTGALSLSNATLSAPQGTVPASSVTITGDSTFISSSGWNLFKNFSGSGTLTLTGSGYLAFPDTNPATNYTGDFIVGTNSDAGTLALESDSVLNAVTSIKAVKGRIYWSEKTQSFNSFEYLDGDMQNMTGTLTLGSEFKYDSSTPLTVDGVIAGAAKLTKEGTGTLTLSQAPQYTGSTTVESGTLQLDAGGTLYNLSGGSLDENGQIDVPGHLIVTGKLTLSNDQLSKFIGSITAPEVEKTGSETLQLCFDAQNAVSIGSLVVSSGRVDLKGYMQGNISVEGPNAVFSPGNSVGDARFGGGYELKEGAKLLIEQDASGIDTLTASSFDINSKSIIEIVSDSLQPGAEYPIIFNTSPDGFQGDMATDNYWNSLLTPGSDYYWNLSVRGGNTVYASVDANAVPEPSTWALLALGVVVLFLRKRVRN